MLSVYGETGDGLFVDYEYLCVSLEFPYWLGHVERLANTWIRTPWVVTTVYAIAVRWMQWKERHGRPQDADAGEEGTTRRSADEETPLLGLAPVTTEGTQQRDIERAETEKHLYHPSSGSSG